MKQAMAIALTATSEKDVSEKKINDLGLKIFSSELKTMKKDYEQTVSLSLVKVDGEWKIAKIEDDSAFINAITGGMIEGAKYMEQVVD
jgi:hypothetical protein